MKWVALSIALLALSVAGVAWAIETHGRTHHCPSSALFQNAC